MKIPSVKILEGHSDFWAMCRMIRKEAMDSGGLVYIDDGEANVGLYDLPPEGEDKNLKVSPVHPFIERNSE
jgi:hypothetical protein